MTTRRLKVLILGSTGSIGTQALDVIAANPDRFEVVGLAAGGGNVDELARQRAQTGVTNIAVADEKAAEQLGAVRHVGPDAATRMVEDTEADVVLDALVGALGLKPTLAALTTGARLALANKESLVAGGPLVLKAAAPGQIVPVDSEHSALAQCLRSGAPDEVARLVLTASGGPFRGWSAADLETVTPEQAGAHPHLVDGPDEHAELGIDGEQGSGADRDASAFRHRIRPHRRGSSSAVRGALDGDLHRRLDHRPGQSARHATADRAGARLAGSGRRRGRCLRLHHGSYLGVRTARRGCLRGGGPRPARG